MQPPHSHRSAVIEHRPVSLRNERKLVRELRRTAAELEVRGMRVC